MTTPTHYTLLLLTSLFTTPATACTIVSAVAENGQVWNMNNEDGPRGVANYINVFRKRTRPAMAITPCHTSLQNSGRAAAPRAG